MEDNTTTLPSTAGVPTRATQMIAQRVDALHSEAQAMEAMKQEWLKTVGRGMSVAVVQATSTGYTNTSNSQQRRSLILRQSPSPLLSRICKPSTSTAINSLFCSLGIVNNREAYIQELRSTRTRLQTEQTELEAVLCAIFAESCNIRIRMFATGQQHLWPAQRAVLQKRECITRLKLEIVAISKDLLFSHELAMKAVGHFVADGDLLVPPADILRMNRTVEELLQVVEEMERSFDNENKKLQRQQSICDAATDWLWRKSLLTTINSQLNQVMESVRCHLTMTVRKPTRKDDTDCAPDAEAVVQEALDSTVFSSLSPILRPIAELVTPMFSPSDDEIFSYDEWCARDAVDWKRAQHQESLDLDSRICLYRYRTDFCQLQEKFSQFISDERFREGRVIRRWLEMFESIDVQAVAAKTVTDFVMHCARNLVMDHQIGLEAFEGIHGLLEGHIFPIVFPRFFEWEVSKTQKKDRVFREKCAFLRLCPPATFEGDDQYFRRPEASDAPPPYWKAIDRMGDLEYILVPADILLCIYETVMVTYEYASWCTGVNAKNIGADTLFPLLLYVVVHADLIQPHATLGVIKIFSSKDMLTSELGYYLCVWEAAITYVLEMDVESFGKFLGPEQLDLARSASQSWILDGPLLAFDDTTRQTSDSIAAATAEASDWVSHIETMEDLVESLAF